MTAMANPSSWYIGSSKWSSVTAWAASTARAAGDLIRQSATPAVGSERVWVCIVAGTSKAAPEPTWTLTKGSKTTTDGTVTWMECTGQPAVNGDSTNTPTWAAAAKGNTVALGQIVQRASGGSYQICTTQGTAGSGAEPAFSNTAGVTTTDNTVHWTSLGPPANFSPWGAPHARIMNANAGNWAGTTSNTRYISNNHAETQSTALTLTMGGSTTAFAQYLCVSDAVAPPTALAATATVSTTGAKALTLGQNQDYFYAYGIGFNCASGATGDNLSLSATFCVLDTCSLNLIATGAGNQIIFGLQQVLMNSALTFANSGQQVTGVSGALTSIRGGSMALTGTVPTTLFGNVNSETFTIRDCDLSAVTGKLFDVSLNAQSVEIADCTLGPGVSLVTTSNFEFPNVDPLGLPTYRFHNCDSGTTNYRFYDASYFGTIQQETTVVRTGGASDGTRGLSWNVTSSANPQLFAPLQLEEIVAWNDQTGSSLTATVEIAGANTLTNADIWLEIEYPGSAAVPLGATVNNRVSSPLATPANVPSSSAAWGGSPAVTQKLQVSFTPQMKGPIRARIYVAKPNITVYVDPVITLAGVTLTPTKQYLIPGWGYINEMAARFNAYLFTS